MSAVPTDTVNTQRARTATARPDARARAAAPHHAAPSPTYTPDCFIVETGARALGQRAHGVSQDRDAGADRLKVKPKYLNVKCLSGVPAEQCVGTSEERIGRSIAEIEQLQHLLCGRRMPAQTLNAIPTVDLVEVSDCDKDTPRHNMSDYDMNIRRCKSQQTGRVANQPGAAECTEPPEAPAAEVGHHDSGSQVVQIVLDTFTEGQDLEAGDAGILGGGREPMGLEDAAMQGWWEDGEEHEGVHAVLESLECSDDLVPSQSEGALPSCREVGAPGEDRKVQGVGVGGHAKGSSYWTVPKYRTTVERLEEAVEWLLRKAAANRALLFWL
jgi:hypothetical protein